jgi:hypothetical protein
MESEMVNERKWFLRSRVFWLNTVSLIFAFLIVRTRAYTLTASAILNLGLRAITAQRVGKEEWQKRWYRSKTVWLNLIVIAVAAYNLIGAGEVGDIFPPLLALLSGFFNLYLRTQKTDVKLTLLPGPFGRIV